MNGIVIVDPDGALGNVASACAAHGPTVVWEFGPDGSLDERRRSLDALVEPFVDGYFSGEAARRTADALRRAGVLEADDAALLRHVLDTEFAGCLRTVERLDRAHQLHPIEAVVVGTDDVLAATAVAWAAARGITSIAIDAARRDAGMDSGAERVVVLGERARRACARHGIDERRITVAADPRGDVMRSVVANRAAYRARVAERIGWPAAAPLVAFEPRTDAEQFEATLAEMYAALIGARAQLPDLRLALVVPCRVPDGIARATALARTHGLAPDDLVYAEADADVWTALADVVVSCDSARSFDAAVAGIAAVNLWHPESWFAGPAFGADDGIVECAAEMLGATLVALLTNAEVRAQIVAIARDRAGAMSLPGGAAAPGSAPPLVAALTAMRTPRPAPAILKAPLAFVVYAPAYVHASAGIRALYRLCHFINLVGGECTIHPGPEMHPTWRTPRRTKRITGRTVVVYPETAGPVLPEAHVVRWVLNVPGLLGGPTRYGPDDMVFFHAGFREAAQRATDEILTDERELTLSTIEPDLYYTDRSQPRLYDCVYVGKGQALYDRVRPAALRDALLIRREPDAWPANRADTAALLRGCRTLFSYDAHTAIAEEAVLCGAAVTYVGEDGTLIESPAPPRDRADAGASAFDELSARYARAYYDPSPVERFVRLVHARWR